jgi:hypothetical protein
MEVKVETTNATIKGISGDTWIPETSKYIVYPSCVMVGEIPLFYDI